MGLVAPSEFTSFNVTILQLFRYFSLRGISTRKENRLIKIKRIKYVTNSTISRISRSIKKFQDG